MPIWEHLRHFVTGPQLPWVILWLGLATLIVGLIVLDAHQLGPIAPAAQVCGLVAVGPSACSPLTRRPCKSSSAGSPDGRSADGQITITLVDDEPTRPTPAEKPPFGINSPPAASSIVPPAADLARSESISDRSQAKNRNSLEKQLRRHRSRS